MDPDRVMGLLTRHSDGELSGWCWSPDRPDARLTVEIIADDAPLDSFVADEMSYELLHQGVGDGRHTFRNKPDPSPPGARLLSARERDSGVVFGRVRLDDHTPPAPRVLRLAADLDRLRVRLAAVSPAPHPPGRAARRGFGRVGERLAQPGGEPIASAWLSLMRLLAGVAVPLRAAPACSVVLLARDARRTAQGVRALAPAMNGTVGATRAEFLIVDMGTDAAASLLPACLPAAGHVGARGPRALSDALARALDAARGTRLILIDDPDHTASAAALADLLECDAALAIGQGPASLARALGWRDSPAATVRDVPGQRGVLLAAEVALLRAAGGLDPAFDRAPDAAVLDLCRKAALLGTPTAAPAQPPGAPRSPPIDPAARALLRARWGRVGASAHG